MWNDTRGKPNDLQTHLSLGLRQVQGSVEESCKTMMRHKQSAPRKQNCRDVMNTKFEIFAGRESKFATLGAEQKFNQERNRFIELKNCLPNYISLSYYQASFLDFLGSET